MDCSLISNRYILGSELTDGTDNAFRSVNGQLTVHSLPIISNRLSCVYRHFLTSQFLENKVDILLISNIRRVVNVVFFVLGDSQAFEFYVPTFRNILSVPSS